MGQSGQGAEKRARAAAIAGNLRKAMALRGIGTRKLAELVKAAAPAGMRGISYGAIRGYVAGEFLNPRMDVLSVAAGVLDVRVEWLLFDEGAMTEAAERLRRAESEPLSDDKHSDPMSWMYTRIDVVYPEFEMLGPEAKMLVIAAIERFYEVAPPDWIGADGVDPDKLNTLLLNIRQFVMAPLYAWTDNPDPNDWRVRQFAAAALSTFLLTIPDRPERLVPARLDFHEIDPP